MYNNLEQVYFESFAYNTFGWSGAMLIDDYSSLIVMISPTAYTIPQTTHLSYLHHHDDVSPH